MGQQGVAAPRPDEGSITVRRVTVETCSSWLVLLGDAGATFPPQEEKYCERKDDKTMRKE